MSKVCVYDDGVEWYKGMEWAQRGRIASESGENTTKKDGYWEECYARWTRRNKRATNEDSLSGIVSNEAACFVVADGHLGFRAATFAAAALPSLVLQRLDEQKAQQKAQHKPQHKPHPSTERLISDSFNQVRVAYKTLATLKNPALAKLPIGSVPDDPLMKAWADGACVTAALISYSDSGLPTLTTTWAGDCPAILVSKSAKLVQEKKNKGKEDTNTNDHKEWIGHCLTRAHWPEVPLEAARLQLLAKRLKLKDPSRVISEGGRLMGELQVSRAMGDVPFGDLVWSDAPSCSTKTITEDDRFLVLMTDGAIDALPADSTGLWPVPLNRSFIWARMQLEQRQAQSVAEIVGSCSSAKEAALKLHNMAIERAPKYDITDNMSALVVDLQQLFKKLSPASASSPASPSAVISASTAAVASAAGVNSFTSASTTSTATYKSLMFNHDWPLPPPIIPHSSVDSSVCVIL
jgi:serine/threonine protein phosphatase PrpC